MRGVREEVQNNTSPEYQIVSHEEEKPAMIPAESACV
jgi:hypothetical protein